MIGLISTFLVLASAAAAPHNQTDVYPKPPVLINDDVDNGLVYKKKFIMEYGNGGMSKISSGQMDGVDFSEGFQLGFDTLHRTGDCFLIRKDEETVSKTLQFGYKLMVFAFGKIRYRGNYMSGYFKVKDNVFLQEHTTRNSTSSCTLTLDQYKFTKFDDIEFETSKPLSDDGKLPEDFKEALLKHVNAKMEEEKPGIERDFQRGVCVNSIPNVQPAIKKES